MSKEVEQIDYISAEYYIFYIKVVDSAGKGVKDVRIEWEDTNGSGAGYVYSDSSGIAIVNIDMNKVPPEFELSFTAKKEGFGDTEGQAGQDTSRQYPFELRLVEETNMYYHVVYVKSSNGTYLSNVIVKAYLSDLVDEQTESSQVQVTDLSGKCVFKDGNSNDFYFLATKNGFVPSVPTRHEARSTLDAAERFPLTITLAPSESGHYYYVVKVENEKGEGMADIEIGLYKDMSRTMVYDSGGNSVVRGRRVSAEDTSIDREVFNTVRDTISVISGWPVNTIILDTAYMNNSGLQISQTNMIKIINSLEREYGIVFNEGADSLPVEERVSLFTSVYPTVRDTVDYIRENADFQGKVKISYVTDSAGYLAIDLGVIEKLLARPHQIYGFPRRCFILPGLENFKIVFVNVRADCSKGETPTGLHTEECLLGIPTQCVESRLFFLFIRLLGRQIVGIMDKLTERVLHGDSIFFGVIGL